ncbi:MAG: PilZ domain-containing protein [Candidatus Omnitrophica bacterium]|nr:PilZ domain-containing protein [Candidatus Omnitrophota bacterium]
MVMRDEKDRRHARVREDIPVRWTSATDDRYGRGILRNISISGTLLEAKSKDTLRPGERVIMKAEEAHEDMYVPETGMIMWVKPRPNGYAFYGIEFLKPPPAKIEHILSHVQQKLDEMASGMGGSIGDAHFGLRE